MGSSPTKQRNAPAPTGPKSALKNTTGKQQPQERPNQDGGDMFATSTFRPGAEVEPETGTAREPSRAHRVHYDNDVGEVTNRDGLVLDNRDGLVMGNRADRVDNTVNPWLGSTLPDYQYTQNEPTFRNEVPQFEPVPAYRPLPHNVGYALPQRPPPQYRQLRQPPGYRPRQIPDQCCRPSPFDHLCQPYYVPFQGRQMQPQPRPHVVTGRDQPPPYHTLQPMTYRRAFIPQQNPRLPQQNVRNRNQNLDTGQVIQRGNDVPHDNSGQEEVGDRNLGLKTPNQSADLLQATNVQEDVVPEDNIQPEGGVTDRSQKDNHGPASYRSRYVVESLLSPDHAAKIEAMTITNVPKTNTSVHEKDDDDYIGANLRFYRNQMKFRPDGEYIDYIHKYWYGNYSILEKSHNYIQWLFPTYEASRVNPEAVPLRAHEAKHIQEDPETRERFLTSFDMMLDFYGFRLADEETGKLEKASNWESRFSNLIRSTHNHARITRILKSLGVLGEGRFQAPFVIALLHEVFETKQLFGISPSTIQYWLRSISDDFERNYVYKQFSKGIHRLEKERRALIQDSQKYYFAPKKPAENVIYTQRNRRRTRPR